MSKQSAGILLYRYTNAQLQIFLVHPGGPFFKNKDAGAWSVPKGEFLEDEDPLMAAQREFLEETGQAIKNGTFIKLTPIKLKSGKTVHAWAVEGNLDHNAIASNLFEIEWPPRSGKKATFPEIDRAAWFGVAEASLKVNPAQVSLIEELSRILSA